MDELSVDSQRGRKKLHDGGYLYVFDKWSADREKKYWRCEQRGKKGKYEACPARVHTDSNDKILQVLNVHCHGADVAGASAAAVVTTLKRRAPTVQETPGQMLLQVTNHIGPAISAALPNRDALRKTVQRVRGGVLSAPANPSTLDELVIPDTYKNYESSPGSFEEFLLIDSDVGGKRILAFGREENFSWANEMKKVYVDGTFSMTPSLFQQVYCILAEKRGYVFPVLYALLPDKTEETYTQLLRLLTSKFPAFQPEAVSMDFELAAIKAFKSVFRNIRVDGCLYHLSHNIKKHISHVGLHRSYVQDAEFSVHCRSIAALSFLKPEDVENGIDYLETHLPPELAPILNYFEDTYVGRQNPRTGNRRPPTFPIEMWSVHDRVITGTDRTNNYAEAAHRRLQAEIQMNHPTIWLFIDALRRVQKGRDLMYAAMLRGEEPPRKRRRYMQADERILRVVQDYLESGNVGDLLRGIAYNVHMD